MSTDRSITASLPNANIPVEIYGCTEFKVVKLNYVWTIKNFSFAGQRIESPMFFDDFYGGIKWRMSITEDSCHLALHLYLYLSNQSNGIGAKYKFSILNDKGEKCWTRESQKNANKFSHSQSHGYTDFIQKDILFSKANSLLTDDKLKIFCEIEFVVDTISTSSKSKIVQFKVPDCKLTENLGSLIESENFSDVILVAGDRKFAAHKAILAVRSDVFAAMFHHEMKESLLNIVNITDIDPDVVKEMLHFIYTDKVPNLNKMCRYLLAAADKYALRKLKVMCEESLCINLSVKAAAETLILADLYTADQLKAKTKKFIRDNAKKVMESEGWQSMMATHSHLFAEVFPIKSDDLKSASNEIKNK